jgi:flagellar basal body-associated protein FliL
MAEAEMIKRIRDGLAAAVVAAMALCMASAQAAEDAASKTPTLGLEPVALPVVVDGKLLNYVFVSIKLELSPKSDGSAVRAKEQFFRDDLVRVGHRTPFTRPDDYNKVDEAKVKAEVMRVANSLVGPGVVKNVLVVRQVAQRNIAPPRVTRPRGPEIVP